MEIVRVEGRITTKDVEKFNETLPKIIEISSTKGQSAEILAKLDSRIKIKIVGEFEDKSPKELVESSHSEGNLYSSQEVCEMIETFEDIERKIDPTWSDLEVSLHTYIELIKKSKVEEKYLEDNAKLHNSKISSEKVALKYKEAMNRLGIPCKYLDNENGYAWNEIEIDGVYYPLDLVSDIEYYNSEKSEGQIGICKFLTNKEFYFEPIHKNKYLSEKELNEIRALDENIVRKAYEKISSRGQMYVDRERPTISIKSKELSGIFKGDEISKEQLSQIEPLKISLKDTDLTELKEDLKQITKYYPEMLRNVELENATESSINMQEIIDQVYSRSAETDGTISESGKISITISSKFAEDFDLDFSNAPKQMSNSTPVDGEKRQKITLKNLSSEAIRLPSLKGKISENIEEIEVEGLDLKDLDISDTKLQKLTVKSELSKNIADFKGFERLTAIALEAVNDYEFNRIYPRVTSPSSDVHEITFENINLENRKILEELARNPGLVNIGLYNCNVNDIDGLELFDGRLRFLDLRRNKLNISDIERLNAFWENNPYLSLYANSNSYVWNLIVNAPEISDESHRIMDNQFFLPGMFDSRIDKNNSINSLLWDAPNIPYYIKDAEIIRRDLKLTRNPMMLENDSEIDTFDFNKDYLRDGTLLLTIPQIERLLSSGKVIPQKVRINIHDVSELTSQKARELLQQMNDKGMNLSGVQIFDENTDNEFTQITPYSMSQYVYIRDTLDMVVSGIDQTEPDIDKFATVYQRLMDSIVYDYGAADEPTDTAKALYYSEKVNSSRNLLEGLEEGKCVCAGYADILRNALSLVGIEARLNTGNDTNGAGHTGRHAWNQVELDDGTGNKKWYYTDLTWDAELHSYDWTLLGAPNFTTTRHQQTVTQDIENVEMDDYDRVALREAFARARSRSFDFKTVEAAINIPEDPQVSPEIINQDRIRAEYIRRKNDMYAKFYGDRNYQAEYDERSRRYRENEIEVVEGGITYRTIDDYPEREEDEQFLLLDKYKDCLERMTRYEAGDTSVYHGTNDQIRDALEKDREYVETRNHTFDQHRNTQNDLGTLGKYGERVPYIPRQQGTLKNIVRAVGNVGIFARNLVSPVYRVVGRYVAQPLHRAITRGRDASPYRNNWYHRMVARRDYFEEHNNNQNPGHPIRNAIKSRADAIFKSQEGNEAVLRAGAADIRANITNQEREIALIQNLTTRRDEFNAQIEQLEQEILNRPRAVNIVQVRNALQNKIAERDRLNSLIESHNRDKEGILQTDAVSDSQHAVASKEVNTMRVTVIKGVAKGIAAKYIGPKIHEWLLERGKVTKTVDIKTEVPETKQRWVDTTYKNETVPVYEDVMDTNRSMSDIISANEGKDITGFYSVYGGERGAATYELTGNEKITAIFQSKGMGGNGLSDKVGLTAPTLTDGTFAKDLLDTNGLLNQNTTLTELLEALNVGNIDTSTLSDMYVSVGDRYWVKLSDLIGNVTTKVQIGEEVKKVIDVAGHYENYTEMVEKIVKTTEVVTNPAIEKVANIGSKVGEGAIMIDGILDVAENLRKTSTEVKSNKKQPREYTFDEEVDDIPKSRRDYRRRKTEEEER